MERFENYFGSGIFDNDYNPDYDMIEFDADFNDDITDEELFNEQ